jgi:glycosyltransferase involved in cell wall biosynthesis
MREGTCGIFRSVRAQSVEASEIVVVQDGPCPETAALVESGALGAIRHLVHDERRGGSAARNSGIAAAKGDLIALLDDDDEFLPTKIERQLFAFENQLACIAASRFVERSRAGETVCPRALPQPRQAIGDYLFVRKGLFRGEAEVQTSTLMAPKSLFDEVRFDEQLRRHQDWDWVLRAAQIAPLVYIPDALTIRNRTPSATRVKARSVDSLAWIDQMRPLVGDRAYSAFLLTVVSRLAADERSFSLLPTILRKAFGAGPRLVDLVRMPAFWALSPAVRDRLRHLVHH